MNVNWTKKRPGTTSSLSHIRSCGYSSVCPQTGRFPCLHGKNQAARSRSQPGYSGNFTGVVDFFLRPDASQSKPVEIRQAQRRKNVLRFTSKKYVYRIVVMVNVGALLWINPLFSTRSAVYVQHKPVGCSCMALVGKLDKNLILHKTKLSSHSVPVDIHTFIHTG